MNAWASIVARLGEPTNDWPKNKGHLKHEDRFNLVCFLIVNKIPRRDIARLPATSSCASSVSTCVARSWRWRRVVSSADFASASSRTSWSIRSSFSSNSSSIWAAVSSAPDGLGSGTSSSLVRAWSGEWW